MIHALL